MWYRIGLVLLVVCVFGSGGAAQTIFTPERQTLIDEHVYAGLPDGENVYVRQGYILGYDPANHIPKWVAYHITPDYLNRPDREGPFNSFRVDPDISNPIAPNDYKGLQKQRGYARGHLAEYAIMGGDRDDNGAYATDGDEYDIKTVYECNYMSNIAPQHQSGFNGSGGLWYKLEKWVRDTLVGSRGCDVWVFAGCIVGPGECERVGPDSNIAVPAMFYKIVVCEGPSDTAVLAFLFPHQRVAHGQIQSFLVTVDVIENLTGLDFFSAMEDDTERKLEATDTWTYWKMITADPPNLCKE